MHTLIDIRIPFGLELFSFGLRIGFIAVLHLRLASHALKNEPLHAALAGLAPVAVLGHAEGPTTATVAAERVARTVLVFFAPSTLTAVRADVTITSHVCAFR